MCSLPWPFPFVPRKIRLEIWVIFIYKRYSYAFDVTRIDVLELPSVPRIGFSDVGISSNSFAEVGSDVILEGAGLLLRFSSRNLQTN